MKKALCGLAVVVSLALAALGAFAQEKSQIKVKGTEVVTGVVIVDISMNGKRYELQCNEGASFCTPLKAGTYTMLELPEHYGLYDCKNVQVYAGGTENPSPSDRLGEYCLITK